jgi:glycosyltransferase involved in cell wall biosynthesis
MMCSKRKKVTFVLSHTDGPNVGGMEIVAANLLHTMSHEKYDFSLICFNGDNGIIPRIERDRVSIDVVEKKDGIDLSMIPKLASRFRAGGTDLVHSLNNNALIYAMPAAKLARVSSFVHGEHGRVDYNNRWPLMKQLRVGLECMSDKIIAVSEDVKRICMEEGIPEKKIEVVINGVQVEKYDRKKYRETSRRELGLQENDWAVGTVASLTEIKNLPLFLRSVANVKGLRAFLAGKGPKEEEIRHLIQDLGIGNRVVLLGERNDIPHILSAFDVFTLSSFSEGTSIALLEAMAAELPVVATNVGGNGKVVKENETGFLIPSGDIEEFSKALKWTSLHREECRKMGKAGQARIAEHFSLNRTIDAYDSIFQRALNKKRS